MIKGTKLFKVTLSGAKVDPKAFNQYEVKRKREDGTEVGYDVDYAFNEGSENDYIEKAKANYRWMLMSMNLNKGLETLSGIKTTGDNPSTIPSEVSFILTYTQPDALWYKDEETGKIESEDKVKVIEKIIKDTLNQKYNVILTYFDTKSVSEKHESSLRYGTIMKETEVEAVPVTPTVVDLEDDEEISYYQFLPEEE